MLEVAVQGPILWSRWAQSARSGCRDSNAQFRRCEPAVILVLWELLAELARQERADPHEDAALSRKRRTALYLLTAALGMVAAACLWRRSEFSAVEAAPAGVRHSGAGTAAKAAPRVDFSGPWELDLEASDSLDPILTAYGLSALERSLICNAPVTQTITQTPGQLEIAASSGWFKHTETMPTLGQPHQALAVTGKPVEAVTNWNDGGDALVTVAWPGGNARQVTITRSLEGESMVVETRYFQQSGETLACRRIFRRLPGEASPEPARQSKSASASN